MHEVRRFLGGCIAIVLLFGCRKTERYEGSAPPADCVEASRGGASTIVGGNARYQEPLLDLPAERLSERVDGAEVKLRALGCRRLRVWRVAELSADLELLSFSTEQGATGLLAEQVGTQRSPNVPGDEGWIGENALYFRRGSVLVRLVADAPTRSFALRAVARGMEQALAKGDVRP